MTYSTTRLAQLEALRGRLNAAGDSTGYYLSAFDTFPHGNSSDYNRRRLRARNRINTILRHHRTG